MADEHKINPMTGELDKIRSNADLDARYVNIDGDTMTGGLTAPTFSATGTGASVFNENVSIDGNLAITGTVDGVDVSAIPTTYLKLDCSNDPLTGALGVIGDLDTYSQATTFYLSDTGWTYDGNDYHIQAIVGGYGGWYDQGIGDVVWTVTPDGVDFTAVDGTTDVGVSCLEIFMDMGFGAPFFVSFFVEDRAEYLAWLLIAFGEPGPTTYNEDYWQPAIFTANGATSDFTYVPDANLTPIGSTPSLTLPLSSTFNVDQTTGNITTIGQYTSTLAVGTAPFAVTSTTLNTNLNADYLDGYHASNNTASIPISNGTVNTNLNADLWDGYQFADYLDQAVKQASSPTFANATLSTTGKLYFNDTSQYIYSDADNYITVYTPAAGGLKLAQAWGTQVMMGSWASSKDSYTKLLYAYELSSKPANTGTWCERLARLDYYVGGWDGDSTGNRQCNAFEVQLGHYTPYKVNYESTAYYNYTLQSRRDWVTAGTPTLAVRASAFNTDILIQNDYAGAVYAFYQGQGRVIANDTLIGGVNSGAKVDQWYGASFGRCQIGEDSTYNTEVTAAYGWEVWPVTVFNLGKLTQYTGGRITFPTLNSGIRDNVDMSYGIRFLDGSDSDATYGLVNLSILDAIDFNDFTGGYSYALHLDNWDNQNTVKAIYLNDLDATSACAGIYINDISVNGDIADANAWGIYVSNAKCRFDDITIVGGGDISLDTSTGTKIGTATNQLLGFYNATPVNQPDTVADPSGVTTDEDVEARTAINSIIDRLQELGLIA